jgi:hypothetical protein
MPKLSNRKKLKKFFGDFFQRMLATAVVNFAFLGGLYIGANIIFFISQRKSKT